MGGIVEMIDFHAHLLRGLDDGAKMLEESVQMCWISYKDGVRTIVATPHNLNGLCLIIKVLNGHVASIKRQKEKSLNDSMT